MIRLKKTLVNIFFILLSFCFISCSNDEAITQNVSDNAELEYAKENSQLKKEINNLKEKSDSYSNENIKLKKDLKEAVENLKVAENIIIELSINKLEKTNNTPPQLPVDAKKPLPLPPKPPSSNVILKNTKLEAEEKAKAEAKAKIELDAKVKAEAETKADAEAKAYKDAKIKSDSEAKAKLKAEANAKAELDLKNLEKECWESYKSNDYNNALLKCAELSNKNNIYGIRIMAQMYLNGHGINQNISKANELFIQTAESGDIWSINHLADNAMKNKDYINAHKWFSKGEELDDINSVYQLGLFYYNGLGVTQDFGISYSKFIKSAEKNHADSQFYIGKFHHFGNGSFVKSPVGKDYFKALEWYTLSSNQTNNKAQNNIGVLYYVGDGNETYKGFKPDVKKSLEWFKLAHENGNLTSATNIDLAQSYIYGRDDKRLSELIIN